MRPPCAPAHLLRIKTGPGSQDRTDGLWVSVECSTLLSFSRWSPAPESNSRPRFTGAAHRQQCLRSSKPGASGANRTLIGRLTLGKPYRASALPLSYTGWSRRADSNRHLSFTRARFFPLNYFDMERVTGFEPVSGPWQGPILAARRYPPGASGENRTLLACLEGRNSTNKSHS